jgi:hypothetical protein
MKPSGGCDLKGFVKIGNALKLRDLVYIFD